MAFRGGHSIRSKKKQQKIIEQINTYDYLGCYGKIKKKIFQTNHQNSYKSQDSSDKV
jgi:hypothetical protein